MSWHSKYWDTVDQFYWDPSLLGLAGISSKKWIRGDGSITIPSKCVQLGGSIYARKGTAKHNHERMRRLEEPLNHIFDITFGIAPSAVIQRLFGSPLGFNDDSPFIRLGREIAERYPEMSGSTTTQQDGFFVSEKSIIGVELKLGAATNSGQVLKYIALMASEQKLSGPRDQVGLLYITPVKDRAKTLRQTQCDEAGALPSGFTESVPASQRNARINSLLTNEPDLMADVASRIRIRQLDWSMLAERARQISKEQNYSDPGQETLGRLMSGFASAIEEQQGCLD